MPDNQRDIQILRDLAKQYADLAAMPIQEERRRLWRAHFSLKKTRPLVLATYGMWNVWCREVFGDDCMECEDQFLREHERWFRMQIFHDSIGDDFILEPWITQHAVHKTHIDRFGWPTWGIGRDFIQPDSDGGAWKEKAPIKNWEDVGKLIPPHHEIDDEATDHNVQRLTDAVGDIIEVDVNRQPALLNFSGDISTTIGTLRGLDQLMVDMYESPEELRGLLALMRDGILANHQQAEDAGDFSLTTQENQAMAYAEELEQPRANSGPRKRNQLWGFCAAQEYTLVSPEFHDEFLFQYQIPIMENFGLVHYGCCEDLTLKIDMLRKLKNLRSIAVTPAADVRKCAEQIGTDYAISWRPSPAEMVCVNWDVDRIRRVVRDSLEACKDGFVHVHLKDIETVQGDLERLPNWTRIVGEIAEEI